MGLWQGAWMWCVDGYHLQKYFSQQASYKWANRLKDGKEPELSLPDCLDHFPFEIFALPCRLSLCGQPSGTGKSFIINFQYLTDPAVCHWGATPCSFLVSRLPSHLWLFTRHIGCWENRSHTLQWLKLPRCRAVTWPITLPHGLWQHNHSCFTCCFCMYAHSFSYYSDYTP